MPGYLDDYEPVEDRLRAFKEDEPEGRVVTELVHDGDQPGQVILFKALVYRKLDPDGEPAATGYAHQRLLAEPPMGRNGRPNESAPEWTSPWEVAETSAVGRALANLGYAAKGKRPSREEMSKASATTRSKKSGAAPGRVAANTQPAAPDATPAEGTELPSESGGEVADGVASEGPRLGKASKPSGDHDHTWTPSPTLEHFDVCRPCGATRDRRRVPA